MQNKQPLLIATGILILALVGVGVFYARSANRQTQSQSVTSVARDRDLMRTIDISQIQQGLELYFTARALYPQSLLEIEGEFLPTVPRDPVSGSLYDYAVSANRTGYALGARLEDPSSSLLSADVGDTDGIIYGVDCNDPVYCREMW
ncbi:MAG: hypothetical protein Q7S49_02705 [bacterium]|nr:hypothetical protein [bacterium]